MLIESTNIRAGSLSGKVVLITGAGGGIGYEAARAMAYLGAKVIIAEIDRKKGKWAQNSINGELCTDCVSFFCTDITDDKQVQALYDFIKEKYSSLDVLFNNATITPIGAVERVSIADWDKSYAVNLRAPILLTQKFLPWMKEKNKGILVFVPSSGAAPYMGAYEVYKTAQVEVCNTLAAELEGSNIITYAIGPGLVKTETAQEAIEIVSSFMNLSIEEFYKLNDKHIISVEEAGVGFALSVVNAGRYNGQEIGAIQALMDAGVFENHAQSSSGSCLADAILLKPYIENLVIVFEQQYTGWLNRNLYERQWVLRDFKKHVGMSADNFHKLMINISDMAQDENFESIVECKPWLVKLKEYYIHQNKLLQGYEKDLEKLNKNSQVIRDWIDELQTVIDKL